jgi:hypothetical protein
MSYTDVLALMPENWDDRAQWDVYFDAYRNEKLYLDPMIIDNNLLGTRFIPNLAHHGYTKVWIPGCGASVLPTLLASFGFEVWASDVSRVAVEIQQDMQSLGIPFPELVDRVKSQFKPESLPAYSISPGNLHIVQHDLQTDFTEDGFDSILNIRAFQGLPPDTMMKAASTHWKALAKGKPAIFDTMNVQGERRTLIEHCLTTAGFFVPGRAADEWYRSVLNDTGIAYIMILGQPFPRRDSQRHKGKTGEKKYQADLELLRSFEDEYSRRLTEEMAETERKLTDGVTKPAHIVYSTG